LFVTQSLHVDSRFAFLHFKPTSIVYYETPVSVWKKMAYGFADTTHRRVKEQSLFLYLKVSLTVSYLHDGVEEDRYNLQ